MAKPQNVFLAFWLDDCTCTCLHKHLSRSQWPLDRHGRCNPLPPFYFQLLLRSRKTSSLCIQRYCSPNASFVGPFFSLTHCLSSANVETRFWDNECNVLLKKTMADILTVINTAAKLVAAVLNGISWKQAVMILFLTLSSPDLLVLKFSSFWFQTWLSLDKFVGMYLSCSPRKYCFPKVVKRSLKILKEKRVFFVKIYFFHKQLTTPTIWLTIPKGKRLL